MIKRILSIILTLVLLLSIVPMTFVHAESYRKTITERTGIDGGDYTLSPSLAAKLNDIFDGNAGIYADRDCLTPVDTYLGASPVRNNGVLMYVGPEGGNAMERGTSCFIYANGVYYTLFGETTGDGTPGEHSEALDLSQTGSRQASYETFKAWGVRQGIGALVRASGHSFIVLDYDEESLTYLDGNGDGQGLVAIRQSTWDKVFYSYVSYIIQPEESHYAALYATGKCGENLFWAVDEVGTLTISGTGSIQYPGWSYYNDQIKKVVIPDSDIGINNGVFYQCTALEEVVFEGFAPELSESAFLGITAILRYPATVYGWTEVIESNYGGTVTWEPYGMTELKITSQPGKTYVHTEDTISVSVAAEGDGLTYTWYCREAEDDLFVKSSVSGPVYRMKTGEKSGDRQVVCLISDQYGNSVSSEIVLLRSETV